MALQSSLLERKVLISANVTDHLFQALVDSSSTHYFIDTCFTTKHNSAEIWFCQSLFDDTSNAVITQAVNLQITFSSREKHEVLFYVTLLDLSCSVVLGHNWLTCYNPLIDWVLGNIFFEATPHAPSSSSTSPPLHASACLATPISDPHEESLKGEAPKIALISMATFAWICRMNGTEVFSLR